MSCECFNCDRYINQIKKLEEILDEHGLEYNKIKMGKIKIVPDTPAMIDLRDERIEELVNDHYDERLFLMGYKGVVEFIHKYVVVDDETSSIVYVCADQSKKVFHYYTEEGLQKDIRCKDLMDAIYDPLVKKVSKIYHIMINNIYDSEEIVVDDDSDSDDYDSDIEEIIAEELHESKPSDGDEKTVDERVNEAVALFLEIKKCLGKVRKPVVDILVDLLSL